MNIERLKRAYENNQMQEALLEATALINRVKNTGKLSCLKACLAKLEDEYSFYIVVRILDYGLMYQYSSFIERIAYKRYPSLWTLSWNIDDYIDKGRTLEVAELLKNGIESGQFGLYDDTAAVRIIFAYVQVLTELKRYEEAERWLSKVQDINGEISHEKWGYYYLETGERGRAKQHFLQGLSHQESGYKCYAMLSHLEGAEGNHKAGLRLLEEGESAFGMVPVILMERIRRLRDLHRWEEMMNDIAKLEAWIPDSFYSHYVAKLKADYFYEQKEYGVLASLLQSESSLKDLPYRSIKPQGESRRLLLNPIIQQYNYCVPASLSMILQYYGEKKSQEEIADKIFDRSGSKLSKTIEYWEKEGYNCRYITADIETIRCCIEHGVPILLSVNIGLYSHVHVITGYDDRIGVIYIQDANTLDTMMISYEDYKDSYLITNYLGIIGVPPKDSRDLHLVGETEDAYYRQLFTYLERMDQDAEYISEMLAFLQKHRDHPYTRLYIIKHLHDDLTKAIFIGAVQEMEQTGVDNDAVYLHITNGFLNFGMIEQAIEAIGRVKKQSGGFYQFLQGRISYEQDHFYESVRHFKQALKTAADDSLIWSYLAVSYLFNQECSAALEASTIAYGNHNDDLFIIFNHCKVLMGNHLYEEALQVLAADTDIADDSAYKHFTLAQIYESLGRTSLAVASARKTISLDCQFSDAYILLADLLESKQEKTGNIESILLEGLERVQDKQGLYIRLAHLYLEYGQYDKGLEQLERGMAEYPDYALMYIQYGDTLMEMGNKAEALAFFERYRAFFKNDVEYLINAGLCLLYQTDDYEVVDQGLAFLEEGLEIIENDWEETLNIYLKTVIDQRMTGRGIEFLTRMAEQNNHLASAFLTYKEMLMNDLDNSRC
ncbi:MAG: tetratricopeptide repeat protein [Bacillus sp. (in: firmicutes)]